MSIASLLTPARSAWALAGMLAICSGLYLWGNANAARLELANEKLGHTLETLGKARVALVLAGKQMVAVAVDAEAARKRAAAADIQKKKVMNAEDGPVPDAIRAALDGVRDLRAGRGDY